MFIAIIIAFHHQDIKLKGILTIVLIFFYAILTSKFKPYKIERNPLYNYLY